MPAGSNSKQARDAARQKVSLNKAVRLITEPSSQPTVKATRAAPSSHPPPKTKRLRDDVIAVILLVVGTTQQQQPALATTSLHKCCMCVPYLNGSSSYQSAYRILQMVCPNSSYSCLLTAKLPNSGLAPKSEPPAHGEAREQGPHNDNTSA